MSCHSTLCGAACPWCCRQAKRGAARASFVIAQAALLRLSFLLGSLTNAATTSRFGLAFDQPLPFLLPPLQADGPPLLVCKGALSETVQLCSSVLQGDEEVLPLDEGWVGSGSVLASGKLRLLCCAFSCSCMLPSLGCQPPSMHCCHTRRAREELLALGERLNQEGLRVLAVAVRELPDLETALSAAGTGTGTGASPPGTPLAPLTPSAPKEASRHGVHSGHIMHSVASPSTPPGAAGGGGSMLGDASPSGLQGASGGGSPLAFAAASRRSSMTSIATQRAVSVDDEQDLIFVGFLAFLVG